MDGHVARTGGMRNAHKILVVKPKGKGPLGRPRHRWEANIRKDIRNIYWESKDWINLH